jgi:hypothetical protein
VRDDLGDVVYKSKGEKFDAVVEDIRERHAKGQPILVGTIAIETSEMFSTKLKRAGIKHNVLNAKQHEREAEIVAQAGRFGALTISTNMAGRGTDIVLGGLDTSLAKYHNRAPEFPRSRRISKRARRSATRETNSSGLIVGIVAHEAAVSTTSCAAVPVAGRSAWSLYLPRGRPCASSGPSASPAGWSARPGGRRGDEHRLDPRRSRSPESVGARNFDIRKPSGATTMNRAPGRPTAGAGRWPEDATDPRDD